LVCASRAPVCDALAPRCQPNLLDLKTNLLAQGIDLGVEPAHARSTSRTVARVASP